MAPPTEDPDKIVGRTEEEIAADDKPVGGAPEPEPDPDDDDEPGVDQVLEELEKIGQRLDRAERPEPRRERAPETPAKPEVPEDIRALLASDDPDDKREGRIAQRQWEAEQRTNERLDKIESRSNEAAIAAAQARIEPEIRAAVDKFGLSARDENEVVDYLTDPRHPERDGLSFEKAILERFPGRQPVSRQPAADTNGGSPAPRRQPGAVIAGTGTGGRAPAKFVPSNETTTEMAVASFFKDRGFTR